MAKIAFLGLGVMGFPMARHLVQDGNEVVVYNRTQSKAEKFISECNAKTASSPADASKGADIVFACVGDDADITEITTSKEGAFSAMKPQSLFVDHTTASASVSRELANKAMDNQIGFIDAPVSGGQAGAENGTLTIMCGGSKDAFHKAQPVMSCYGKKITLMGPSGSGQLTKMVNQICIAGLVQGLSEALMIEAEDLDDMEKLLGMRPDSWQAGEAALEELVLCSGPERDADFIRYFHRRLSREESLLYPVLREQQDAALPVLR